MSSAMDEGDLLQRGKDLRQRVLQPMKRQLIGKDEIIEVNHSAAASEIVYKFKGQDKEFIPEQRLATSKAIIGLANQVQTAGYYDLFLKEEEVHSRYAFNFDRQESDLRQPRRH